MPAANKQPVFTGILAIIFMALLCHPSFAQMPPGYGLTQKPIICPGEVLFKDRYCLMCGDGHCIDSSHIYEGIENNNVVISSDGLKDGKIDIYEMPLTTDKQTYFNTILAQAMVKSALLIKAEPNNCISFQVVNYNANVVIPWSNNHLSEMQALEIAKSVMKKKALTIDNVEKQIKRENAINRDEFWQIRIMSANNNSNNASNCSNNTSH